MKRIPLVIVGHVDHGKSSLIGKILYDTKSIPEDKLPEVIRASKRDDNEIEYAFILDLLKEEREQGITIETTQTFFSYNNKHYTIIDAPGHVQFIKNMITGASQAKIAVIIIDAYEGIRQQTIRHAYILSLLAIKKVIVVINKMDKVRFNQEVYDEIRKNMSKILDNLEIKTNYYIPTSIFDGDNVCNQSDKMPWYKGKTFLETLDSFELEEAFDEGDYIFPVQDVYKINDKRIFVGRIEHGEVKVNDKLVLLPVGFESKVASIEKFDEISIIGETGESIGITAEDDMFVERGAILTNKYEDSPLHVTKKFVASILWMDKEPLKKNDTVVFRCATQETLVSVKEILTNIHTDSLKEKEVNTDELEELYAGKILFEAKKNIVVTLHSQFEELGRFVLVKNKSICAGGIITEIREKENE